MAFSSSDISSFSFYFLSCSKSFLFPFLSSAHLSSSPSPILYSPFVICHPSTSTCHSESLHPFLLSFSLLFTISFAPSIRYSPSPHVTYPPPAFAISPSFLPSLIPSPVTCPPTTPHASHLSLDDRSRTHRCHKHHQRSESVANSEERPWGERGKEKNVWPKYYRKLNGTAWKKTGKKLSECTRLKWRVVYMSVFFICLFTIL